MGTTNSERRSQNQAGDELDLLVDAALAKYTAVEPRAGLEQRILANIRIETEKTADRRWWHWCLGATGVITAVVILAVAWGPHRQSRPTVVDLPSANHSSAEPSASVSNRSTRSSSHEERPVDHVVRLAPTKHSVRRNYEAQAPTPTPKLDQFPSPQPLTEEEKMLAEYVGQHHEQAVLIARAREERLEQYRLQDEKDEAEQSRGNGASGTANY
jgi:hypothetical protein